MVVRATTSIVRGISGKLIASTQIPDRLLFILKNGAQLDAATERMLTGQLVPNIGAFRVPMQGGLKTLYDGVANIRQGVAQARVGVKGLAVATIILKHPVSGMYYVGKLSTVRRRAQEEGRFRGRGYIHANQGVIYGRRDRAGRWYWPSAALQLATMLRQLEQQVNEANYRQSGLTIVGYHSIELRVLKVRGNAGGTYMPTPKKLLGTRWCVNVDSPDDRCFMWAILASQHCVANNPGRHQNYVGFIDEYDWSDVGFPATPDDIRMFEENNPRMPPIHVFEYDAEEPRRPFFNLSRMYLSIKSAADTVQQPIVLLCISKSEMKVNDSGESEVVRKQHYVWCKYPHQLFRYREENAGRYCWVHRREYASDEAYAQHLKDCDGMEMTQYCFPQKGAILQFERYRHLTQCPIVYYCDIECIQPEGEHIPCMFGVFVKSLNESLIPSSYMCFSGANCLQDGLKEMFAHAKRARDLLGSTAYGIIAAAAQRDPRFDYEVIEGAPCCVCERPLDVITTAKGVRKTRYRHCVNIASGEYIGRAHQKCCVDWQRVQFPAYHHNGRGYDHHHIIVELFKQRRSLDFVIAQNMEKLTCMDSGPLRFVDSLQHLACSLERAVGDLSASAGFTFDILAEHNRAPRSVLAKLCQKQPFPYEWFTSWESLQHEGMVEPRYFRSCLHPSASDEEIEKDHAWALDIYTQCDHRTMQEFMALYLETDVLLLAEVMEWYRADSMSRNGGLDPAWYITAPSLALDEVLLHSKEKIELLHEEQEDMFNMILGGIRGGIVQAVLRDVSTTKDAEVRYFDANSLYPWAMQQALPVGEFVWHTISLEELLSVPDDAEYGYFAEIDCTTHAAMHDYFDDLPPCPHKAEARPSPAAMSYGVDIGGDFGNDKLIVDFSPKTDYCVHYRLLKVWMKHRMLHTITIKRALRFRQKPFVKGFIDMNVRVRAEAKGRPGVQNNCKRKMNSVFGKWMENVFKREAIAFMSNIETVEGGFLAAASKPNLKMWNTFGEGADQFTGFAYYAENVVLNKPIFIGAAVLDISKALMYDAFYTLKGEIPTVKLVYMDTDSLVLQIPTGGTNADVQLAKTRFGSMIDSSGLPDSSPLKEVGRGRDKIPGFFKDELGGQSISRFICLRAKTYCYEKNGKSVMKCKGVPGESVEAETMIPLGMADFHRALHGAATVRTTAYAIRSRDHAVHTVALQRDALSGYDDKRWICNDRIHTHAHGHCAITVGTVQHVAEQFNRYSPTKRPRVFSLMYAEDNV
jgi:hypothetical protein